MKVIYVSGPYTGDVAKNVKAAEAQGVLLREWGFCPLVPHIALPPIPDASSPRGYAQAMKECITLLERCDAVLLMKQWRDSRGARIEKVAADQKKIPCFENLEELVGAMGRRGKEQL